MEKNIKDILSLSNVYPTMMKRYCNEYKWFKPLLMVLLAFIFYMIFAIIAFLLCLPFGVSLESNVQGAYGNIDFSNPANLLVALMSLIVAIPAIALALKITGFNGIGVLSSIERKIRWKFFFKCLLCSFIIMIAVTTLELIAFSDGDLGEISFNPLCILIIILLVPLQCAAEEYMLRGALMQTLSSWIPIVIIPALLQALIFAALHPYNIIGKISIFAMGLIAGFLAIKTGGLEASMSMHIANNVISFIMASLFVSQTVMQDISIESALLAITLDIIFMIALLFVSKKDRKLLIKEKQLLND